MNLFTPNKFVTMALVGVNGNAFALIGEFTRNARKQGWAKDEIDLVKNKCMEGDYNDLLNTLMDHVDHT